jgi:hypothetical protein
LGPRGLCSPLAGTPGRVSSRVAQSTYIVISARRFRYTTACSRNKVSRVACGPVGARHFLKDGDEVFEKAMAVSPGGKRFALEVALYADYVIWWLCNATCKIQAAGI